MVITSSSLPLIRAGWMRALLFCVVYLLLILTGVFIMSSIIHHVKGETVDAVQLMKGNLLWGVILMGFAGSWCVTYIFRRWIDRKSFISLGLDYQHHGADLVAGITLALSILGVASLILLALGHLKWTDIIFDDRTLVIAMGNLILVALYEEIVFRGYILGNLLESFNKWVAIIISAGLFTLFHISNPGFDFFSVVNLFAIGILLGLNYAHTGNLWFSISFHFAWNFIEGPILGYPVSGIHFDTLLQTELKGDENITGGAFGLEGSAITMAICILAIIVLFLIMQKKINQQSQPVPGQK